MNFEEGEVLLFDKLFDWSSFDLVKKVRYLLTRKLGKKIKIGHAGTLDPYATGLMILCTGKLTKKIDQIQSKEKEYTGTITLGATTPSYDMETEPDARFPTEHITEEAVRAAFATFVGDIQQRPPVFSAIQVNGKRAYEYARKEQELVLPARPVTILSFELTAYRLPEIDFRVRCSKGTYIRSLAYDVGRALESGAYLSKLCRTAIGEFRLENAFTLEAFEELLQQDIPKH